MSALIDGHDVAMFDLDGVLYLGPNAGPGAVEGVAALVARGVRPCYVTNNAARPARTVVDQLAKLGYPASDDNIVTSAQAVATVMKDALPAGSTVLVAGTQNLVDLMVEAGFVPVDSAEDHPDAVVQGYDPTISWARLEEAGFAVQGGARWFVCNTDINRPTDRGFVPGVGIAVQAVQVTTSQVPTVAGKPYPPLMQESLRRTGATRALFVGDRLDTDIAGANAVGIDSCLVFTGVHGKRDLVEATEGFRPTAIAWDVPGLLEPVREIEQDADAVRCRGVRVTAPGGVATIEGDLSTRSAQLDALWALAHLVWAGKATDYETALGELNSVH